MNHSLHLLLIAASTAAIYGTAQAGVIVDDKWADGSRKEQNLPTESAWFASNSTNLEVSPGKLVAWSGPSSRQFITYFTKPGGLVSLAKPGDTVSATLVLSPTDVGTENNSRNLRFGLFDFSENKRITTDSTPSGKGVKGYSAFLSFGQTFGTPNAVRINARTNSINTDLMGASTAYATLESTGQPANHATAFTNGGTYTMQFAIKRKSDTEIEIKTVITGSGVAITNIGTDSGAFAPICTKFDGFAIRSYSAEATAKKFEIKEFKVEGPEGTTQASK